MVKEHWRGEEEGKFELLSTLVREVHNNYYNSDIRLTADQALLAWSSVVVIEIDYDRQSIMVRQEAYLLATSMYFTLVVATQAGHFNNNIFMQLSYW